MGRSFPSLWLAASLGAGACGDADERRGTGDPTWALGPWHVVPEACAKDPRACILGGRYTPVLHVASGGSATTDVASACGIGPNTNEFGWIPYGDDAVLFEGPPDDDFRYTGSISRDPVRFERLSACSAEDSRGWVWTRGEANVFSQVGIECTTYLGRGDCVE